MAAGFARAAAGSALVFETAAISPLGRVDSMARHVMDELGIDIRGLHGRTMGREAVERSDLIVVLSGHEEWIGPLPAPEKTVHWNVDDPLGWPRDIYDDVRDDIRGKVVQLLEWVAHERAERVANELPGPAMLSSLA